MADGVTIFYPETCVIDGDVEIAADTVIEPFVQLHRPHANRRGLPRPLIFGDSELGNWRRRSGSPRLHSR